MMLKLTVLLLSLGLLNFSTPMHYRHRFQQSMSSESSDSMESAETDQQVTPTSHAPGSDIIIRAPADFGQPNKNGSSAVTVSLRDENTNVSVDILTFTFHTEDEAGKSSAAGESSGFGDEGMQADEPSVTQRDITDEQSYRSDDAVDEENKNVEDDEPESIDSFNKGSYQTPDSPNPSSTGDKGNRTSGNYPANQQTIDFNSDEALQSEVDDLNNDIQADETFIASLDAAKSLEESSSIASNGQGKQAGALSEPVYSTDHGFSSNSEETGQIKSQVESHKSNLDTKASKTHGTHGTSMDGSESQPTHLPEDETMSESLDDTQSQSKELSTTLTTVFHYLFGDLIGLRSVPPPLNPQSMGAALMSSMEETTSTETKDKETDPGLDLSSGPTIHPWVFNGVSQLLFSSEEQEDHDESLVTDVTLSSPMPSPEPLLNPLSAKKDPPKSSSSGPAYVNDGWPAVDYSNSLNDFRHYHNKYGYNSINPYNSGLPTHSNADHETAEHDTAQENTPAYSWEAAAEVQSFPTEDPKTQKNSHNKDQPEFTPDSAASREDLNSSSSETSRETTIFLLPRATDVSPTDTGPVLSNSLESTEPTVGPDSEKGALTVSSSSEEHLEPLVDSEEQSLATAGSNSKEIQTQEIQDTPDWPEKELGHDSGLQQLELAHISMVQLSQNLRKQDKEESSLFMDLTPESSSKEELDQVSSTEAPGSIFSSLPPMSSEEQGSPASISRSRSQPLPGESNSNEEDINASLNYISFHPAPSGNSSSEDDQNEESFSNESSTDSPDISLESSPQSKLSTESVLLQSITERPESVFASDLIVSDEDVSSETSTPNPNTGLEITSQTKNVAKTKSEESQESQEPSLFTLLPPVAIDPSQAPNTKKSSEENTKMDHVENDLMPTATSPKQEEANPWATFLQSLKAHMRPWPAERGEQKVQRPWSKYGNGRQSSQYIHNNKGQKASSSEESK